MTELRHALDGAWYPLEDEEPGDASFRGFYGVHADQVWQLCASTTRKAWVAHTVVDVLDGLDSITQHNTVVSHALPVASSQGAEPVEPAPSVGALSAPPPPSVVKLPDYVPPPPAAVPTSS